LIRDRITDDDVLFEYSKLRTIVPASERGEHFIIAKPPDLVAEKLQVLQRPEDPPKLGKTPPFSARPREPTPFHKPEEDSLIIVGKTAEPRPRPRAGTALAQRPAPE
jgi:hypothetical protein